jgi:hypothetical protein
MKKEQCECHHHGAKAAGGGAIYGLGFVGAAVYYLQHAPTFGQGVLAILRAIVWPALLIYRVLGMLHM